MLVATSKDVWPSVSFLQSWVIYARKTQFEARGSPASGNPIEGVHAKVQAQAIECGLCKTSSVRTRTCWIRRKRSERVLCTGIWCSQFCDSWQMLEMSGDLQVQLGLSRKQPKHCRLRKRTRLWRAVGWRARNLGNYSVWDVCGISLVVRGMTKRRRGGFFWIEILIPFSGRSGCSTLKKMVCTLTTWCLNENIPDPSDVRYILYVRTQYRVLWRKKWQQWDKKMMIWRAASWKMTGHLVFIIWGGYYILKHGFRR